MVAPLIIFCELLTNNTSGINVILLTFLTGWAPKRCYLTI